MRTKPIYTISLILAFCILTNTCGASEARNPYPANAGIDVPIDVVLEWISVPGVDWDDVFFGTDRYNVNIAREGSAEHKGTQIFGTYDPGGLEPCTTYYWKIVGWEDWGEIIFAHEGPLWSFTTISAPEEAYETAGAIPVKVNLYDDLRDDPNNVGKDPNAVDPNAVIELVNRNFRENGFNYRLVIKDVNTINPNDGDPNHYGGDNGHGSATAGDGRIQDTIRRRWNPSDPNDPNNGKYLDSDPNTEWNRAAEYGRKEAIKQQKSGHQDPNYRDPNNWDCIKISIVKALVDEIKWVDPNGSHFQTDVSDNNPGVSIHRRPAIFAATKGIIDAILDHNNRPVGSDSYRAGDPNDPNVFNERMAETCKHEIGHMLTLCDGHQIGPDPNDPNDKADEGGHAPETPHDPNDPNAQANDPNGSGNFMAPSTWRHNSMMTEPQKDEMEKMAKKLARTVSQNKPEEPARKVKQQAGTTSDTSKDLNEPGLSLPSIYDLGLIYLHGLHLTDTSGGDICNIDAIIGVDGVLPKDQPVEAQYTLGFDIDANAKTGVTHGNRNGIDRIVYVLAEGTISDGSFGLIATILNTISQTTQVLPETPSYEIEDRFPDMGVEATPIASSFILRIPKSMLDFSAHCIPVVVTSGPGGDMTYDTAGLFYDRFLWMEYPTMELFGDGVPTPGEEYPFTVSGLQPDSPYELKLEDRVVHTGTLNPNGSDSGSFIFPYDVPITRPNFLVAQDITGEFAFSITSACSDCQCQVEVDKRVWDEKEKKYYWEPCGGPSGVDHTFE